jgi:hypothetical protein
MSSQVKTKDCTYGCGKKIYWNVLQNSYYELNTQQKHICPNMRNAPTKKYDDKAWESWHKPTKQPQQQQEEKPEMSNTFEMLSGSPRSVRNQYQYISDLIQSVKGKVHGSQSHIVGETTIKMLIYFEVPKVYRDSIQESFRQFLLSKERETIKSE